MTLASQQTPFAIDHQHDHDGIHSREMACVANIAEALPAGRRDAALGAAVCTEGVAAVPVEHRLRLAQHAEHAGSNKTLQCDRAKVDAIVERAWR
jgi:hypothetical protein